MNVSSGTYFSVTQERRQKLQTKTYVQSNFLVLQSSFISSFQRENFTIRIFFHLPLHLLAFPHVLLILFLRLQSTQQFQSTTATAHRKRQSKNCDQSNVWFMKMASRFTISNHFSRLIPLLLLFVEQFPTISISTHVLCVFYIIINDKPVLR